MIEEVDIQKVEPAREEEEEGPVKELEPLVEEEKRKRWNPLPHHQLVTNRNVLSWSIWAMRFGVLADSVNSTILRPNYVFMVTPGASPDSFDSTSPFDVAAAQYFLPMTSLLGTAIAATFVGSLSDRIGRRPVMLVCVGFGVIGSIAKYLARSSFWGFCAANFVTGLFGATLAISMAYASDVATSREEKDGVIGSLVAIYLVGNTGGGILAIVMEDQGLFEPLFIGAAMCLFATVFGYLYLIEPDKLLHMGVGGYEEDDDDDEDDENPTTLDWSVVSIILAGALLDNAGSTGLVPFCLSPLAFDAFFADILATGQEPIMSDTAYKWISTLLAIMVVPSAAGSNHLYKIVGAPAACVAANALTAVVTIIVLQIVLIEPASDTTYAIFVTVLYVGFPFTVFSQLTTGPMLDACSPKDRRGFTQGLNTTVMNFGNAISPWLFGQIADSIGTEPTIWICVGISFGAALVNSPLVFAKVLKRKPAKLPDYSRLLKGEDEDLVERALRGEWVPAAQLIAINEKRARSGHHHLYIPYKPFEEDKKDLRELKKHANEDFKAWIDFANRILATGELRDPDKRAEILELVKTARAPVEQREALAKELGSWFADYMVSAGYHVDESPFLYKQMVMSAFPIINKDGAELSEENLEQGLVNYSRVMNHYFEESGHPAYIRAYAGAFA